MMATNTTVASFAWPRWRRVAGVDIGRAAIKIVVLQRTMWRWRIEAFDVVALKSAGADEVQQTLPVMLAHLQVQPTVVATSLPATQALIQNLQLPGPVSDTELETWTMQAARTQLPCAISDVYVDFYRLEENNSVLLAAMRKDVALRHIAAFRDCVLSPAILDLDVLALRRSAGHAGTDGNRMLIVDVGANSVRLHALQGVQIIFSREQLTSGLQDLPLPDLRRRLVQEIRRVLQLFLASSASGAWRCILLAGGYAGVEDIQNQVAEHTGMQVVLANPFHAMTIRPGLDQGKLATLQTSLAHACGLAMSKIC
jgi:type IV pilus assembly protein PilM